MRCLAIAIVLLVVALPARAQWESVEPVEIKGAYGLIIVPENWNGSLFIYAHGYSADRRLITPFPPDLTLGNFLDGRVNMLFQATLIPTLQGYASATTTFRTPGWNVKDSIISGARPRPARTKNTDRLVQLYTDYGGHCGFISEIFPAVDALVAWVERDQKPTLASVRADCPGCRFTDQLPGPWGLKVAERAQRGAPTGSLVCANEPNDCPPGGTCGSKHRCKKR